MSSKADGTPEFGRPTLAQWQQAAAKSAPGGDVAALNWTTPEGIVVKPLYTAADLQGLPLTAADEPGNVFRPVEPTPPDGPR